jgi:hypothetical protein
MARKNSSMVMYILIALVVYIVFFGAQKDSSYLVEKVGSVDGPRTGKKFNFDRDKALKQEYDNFVSSNPDQFSVFKNFLNNLNFPHDIINPLAYCDRKFSTVYVGKYLNICIPKKLRKGVIRPNYQKDTFSDLISLIVHDGGAVKRIE